MSYEGWMQYICESGHRFDGADAYQATKKIRCPHCQREPVLSNSVDDTNGDALGFIQDEDWAKFLHTPEEVKICDMGHKHVVKQATYLIPTEEEIKNMRTIVREWKIFRTPDGEEHHLIREYLIPRPKPPKAKK